MTVALAGEFDLSNTEELERALAAAADADELCLDLAAVEFLDCAALGVILSVVRRADERGVPVVLHRPSPIVRRMFEVSGVESSLMVDLTS